MVVLRYRSPRRALPSGSSDTGRGDSARGRARWHRSRPPSRPSWPRQVRRGRRERLARRGRGGRGIQTRATAKGRGRPQPGSRGGPPTASGSRHWYGSTWPQVRPVRWAFVARRQLGLLGLTVITAGPARRRSRPARLDVVGPARRGRSAVVGRQGRRRFSGLASRAVPFATWLASEREEELHDDRGRAIAAPGWRRGCDGRAGRRTHPVLRRAREAVRRPAGRRRGRVRDRARRDLRAPRPNGAGKTTTISMICGILARDGGEVVVDGRADRSRHDRGQGGDRLRAPGPGYLP